MINSSLEIGPVNEKVRQKLMMPFSFIISPGSVNPNIQTVSEEVQLFPRCERCGAYFSKNCKKDESNSSWFCEICSHQNNLLTENKEEESTKNFPEITSDDFQFVKTHQLGEEITVIYLSLNFHPKDFSIISSSIIDFLQNSNLNKPILFLLGHKNSDFQILAPYQTKYFRDSQNNDIISKIPEDSIQSESNTTSPTNDLPAPVFKFSSSQLNKFDISKFIFTPDQYSNIIKTIEKIEPIQNPSTPFRHFTNSVEAIRNLIQKKNEQKINPIHFVSIIPSIDNYLPSRLLKNLYETLFRVDILTPTHSSDMQDTLETIPGTVSLFNSNNLSRNLSKILLPPFLTKSSSENVIDPNSKLNIYRKRGQGTVYQWNSFARSSGSKTAWRFAKMPYAFEEKGFAFSPVLPSTEQPFVLDIHPDGSSDFINVQITAKMFIVIPSEKSDNDFTSYSSVLRVFNRTIKLSSDVKKIAESINVNSLLWLWVTRTLGQSQRDVLAALYRATARIVKLLINDDQKDVNDEIKKDGLLEKEKIAELVHACCSLKLCDIMSQDDKLKDMARYSLVLSSPNIYSLIPRYDEENKVAAFGNTVYFDVVVKESEDGDESKTKKIVSVKVLSQLMDVLFMERVTTPIPDWCKSPDPETLEFIHSLVSD